MKLKSLKSQKEKKVCSETNNKELWGLENVQT